MEEKKRKRRKGVVTEGIERGERMLEERWER